MCYSNTINCNLTLPDWCLKKHTQNVTKSKGLLCRNFLKMNRIIQFFLNSTRVRWSLSTETMLSVFIFLIMLCVGKFLGVNHVPQCIAPSWKQGGRGDQVYCLRLSLSYRFRFMCLCEQTGKQAEQRHTSGRGWDLHFYCIHTKSEGLCGGVYMFIYALQSKEQADNF